jgi:hypothetical protein
MNGLLDAAVELQIYCDRQNWQSCFIGGIAVQRWGEPRVTRDLDLTILVSFGGETPFIDSLLSRYLPRIRDAREFAERTRALLLRTDSGIGIDISLGALPFEEKMMERASVFSFGPSLAIRTCSAEDLIVMKLFAGRALDVQDAESVVARQKNRLDWAYIEEQLTPLAEIKDDPKVLADFIRLRKGG